MSFSVGAPSFGPFINFRDPIYLSCCKLQFNKRGDKEEEEKDTLSIDIITVNGRIEKRANSDGNRRVTFNNTGMALLF